jgi:hypothetical protein
LSEEQFDDQEATGQPVGYLKYMPVVTFGLRAAALAGLAVSVGVTEAAALSGIFDAPYAVAGGGSTCCITTE